MKWWHLVVAFVAGGFLGFGISGHDVQKLEKAKTAEASKASDVSHARTDATLNVAQVIPGVEKTRWRIKYRPAPNGGCEVAEASGMTDKVGPGSIVISSNQASTASTSKASEHSLVTEKLTIHEPAPKWAASVLAGSDTSLELQLMAAASYRTGPFTLNVAVVVPAEHPQDAAAFVGAGVTW